MRERLAQFAPAVFWAGVIVLLLGVVLIASNVTAGSGRGPVPTEYLLAGGAVLIVLSLLLRPDVLRRAFGIRTVRYGSNALVYSAVFLVILGLLNYVAGQSRFTWRQDFTANKQYTLSTQTIQILQDLKQPVKATAFIGRDPSSGQEPFNAQEIRDRLKEYTLRSSNFTYTEVDPFQHPELVQELNATFNGGVVFQSGSKKQETTSSGESDFTSAILKVTTDQPRAVYFLTGHREHDPNDTGDAGYSTLRQALERDNYVVGTQSLQITTTIPVSATTLVLAGPRSALTDDEVKTLDDYLNRGGRLLLMVDPQQPNPLPASLSKWGVKLDDDEIVDPQFVQGTSALYPAVQQYTTSPITQKMNGEITIIPLVRSLSRIDPAPSGLTVDSIIQSSTQSWGETTLDFQNNPPAYDAGKDLKGPLNMALSVEGTAPISSTAPVTDTTASTSGRKTRLVVMGTSEVVTNRNLTFFRGAGNVDLVLNTINWLAEEESLLGIRPTQSDTRTLTLTSNDTGRVLFLTVIALPALVLLSGFGMWWRRR